MPRPRTDQSLQQLARIKFHGDPRLHFVMLKEVVELRALAPVLQQ
jgi:hypothetical protein